MTELFFSFAFGFMTRRLYSIGSPTDTSTCDLISRSTSLTLKVRCNSVVELDHAEACRSDKIILHLTGSYNRRVHNAPLCRRSVAFKPYSVYYGLLLCATACPVPHDLKVKLGYFWTENIFQRPVHLNIIFLCVNYLRESLAQIEDELIEM